MKKPWPIENSQQNKRWTDEDDEFLRHFYYTVGAGLIGPHDLGRTPSALHNRVAYLKKCGRWEVGGH
jgi:hypothetical protein